MNKKIIFTLSLFFLICQILSFNSFAGSCMWGAGNNNETEDYPWGNLYNELLYETNYSNEVTITNCFSSDKIINIPDTIEGYSVTKIGSEAFCCCGHLKSVTIPNGVTTIQSHAFHYSGLTSITIPDSVTSIADNAFEGCTNFTIYCHKGSVAETYAKSNAIPVVATDISMFTYTISSNEVIITSCDTSATEVVIPEKIQGYPVTAIADNAFENCRSLVSVELPDTLKTIGKEAFCSCIKLKSITIPKNVTAIGDMALGYYNYGGIYKIVSGFTVYGYSVAESYANENGFIFVSLDPLVSITVTPPTKTEYYTGETLDTAGMTVVATLKDGTTKDVTSESTVDISTINTAGNVTVTVTYESKTATFDIKVVDLSMLTYTISNGEVTITDCDESATEVVIPDTIEGHPVTKIGDKAFIIVQVFIMSLFPNNLKAIGFHAFYNCTSLTNINLPDSVTSVNEDAFYNTGYYNNSDNWENDVLYIGKCLIKAKASLAGAYQVKDGIKVIGYHAFAFNDNIISVTLPEEVITIDSWAFFECVNLTSVNIPDGVTRIGVMSFYNCDKLKSMTIPKSVSCIERKSVGYMLDFIGNDIIVDGFCIYGYKDSTAESYATTNNIPFVALDNALSYKGASLLLDGSIGVKVYVDYNSAIVDKTSMTMDVTLTNSDNATTKTEEAELVFDEESESAYAVLHVYPKDIDNITITTKVNAKALDGTSLEPIEATVTVPSYIDLLKDFAEVDEDCAKALDTVVALENYCAYADSFFNNKQMDNITLSSDEESNISGIASPKRSGSINGLTFSQTSLILEERVAIRHYFEMADGFDVNSVTVEGATALLKLTESGKYAYVDVENIPAHELSKQYKVTLTDGVNTMTIEFSAINYVNLNKNNADIRLSNLVKTLYRYSVEADKYYKLLNPDEEEEVIEPPFDEDELPKTEW